jgi:transcriptional regulator with XRE-family HTH domain
MNEESPVALARRADRWPPPPYVGVAPLAMDPGPAESLLGLAAVIGGQVHQRRKQLGLSLETLARRSQVSRAMLSQIERGRSTPTIGVLWKIAHALEAPISALLGKEGEDNVWLLPVASARRLYSRDGRFCSRALFPFDQPRRVEFYELRLETQGEEAANPHPSGTLENLVVSRGEVEITIAGTRYGLTAGDAIQFLADVAHTYRNVGPMEAVLYLVMTHARSMA